LFYNLYSPFEIGYNQQYIALRKTSENKHIDLIKVFEKQIIKDNVFEGIYRTPGLDSVSSAILGISKYDNMTAGSINIVEKPIEQQKKYVKRDSELVMLLAQYNNCIVLRLMKVFSNYSEMDYCKICNTNVSKWYKTKYKKMIERGEITLDFTPNYKLKKQEIGGGHHTNPSKGFFVDSKIYELDVKGMYPTIVLNNNLSFDTLNCRCCEYNQDALVSQGTIDMINKNLKENGMNRSVSKYWVCKRRKGAFPRILQQVLMDREHYLQLLKKEKNNSNPNQVFIEEYQTHQIGAKLFANAGFGLFGNEYFEFSNYKVAECITGEGRRIHKSMEQMAQQAPFNFDIVFGFTDSIFVKVKEEERENTSIEQFILKCKKELGITIEIKNVFQNSIVYGKKNRFVGWIGKEKEEPIIKGLDGMADSNPLWIRRWFLKIVNEIIKRPYERFETIPNMLREAVFELENVICNSSNSIEKELKYTHRLKKYPQDYVKSVSTGILGRLMEKDKGEEVYWFETNCKDKDTDGNFSISVPTLKSLNLQEYTHLLLDKLKDTLEISNFDITGITLELLKKTLPMNSYR
jgi:DNA polymerase, archaea type